MARFRAKDWPHAIIEPEFPQDAIALRKHPEYEEIDAEGNVIKQPEDEVQRPLLSVQDAKTRAPSKPKGKRKA